MTINDALERLVPTVPMELLYRRFRKLKGSKKEQFHLLHESLNDRHGPKGSIFLAELFRRSVRHAEHYANIDEPFHSVRKDRVSTKYPFAKSLVKQLIAGSMIHANNHLIEFVDYEIFPFRTTKSCCENGKPATSIGSGGMDLLLASTIDGVVVPAIGEIKAATEQVGPTFALIQSLMYAAQLLTHNQFLRLKKHYFPAFSTVDGNQPRMDLIVLLEVDHKLNTDDLKYAQSIADDLVVSLSTYLRRIVFYSCTINDHAIKCEAVDA
jgi:hypothetical protein